HEPAWNERGRGLRLYGYAVEARGRAETCRRADTYGGHPRRIGAHAPQRDVRPVQGAPSTAARRPGPAISFDPRRYASLLDPLHRAERTRGGRHHRLLR